MANHIDDATIEYVGILAKLELSGEEKEQAKKDMESMLDYVDKLNELDTSSVEPMSHVFPVKNVFREDVVTNGDGSEDTLKNAPEAQDNAFVAAGHHQHQWPVKHIRHPLTAITQINGQRPTAGQFQLFQLHDISSFYSILCGSL